MTQDHIAEVGKMIDWTKPLETVSGDPATLLDIILKNKTHPRVVIIHHRDKDEEIGQFMEDGYYFEGDLTTAVDLRNVVD